VPGSLRGCITGPAGVQGACNCGAAEGALPPGCCSPAERHPHSSLSCTLETTNAQAGSLVLVAEGGEQRRFPLFSGANIVGRAPPALVSEAQREEEWAAACNLPGGAHGGSQCIAARSPASLIRSRVRASDRQAAGCAHATLLAVAGVFIPDPTLSSPHALVAVEGAFCRVKDLGSRNKARANRCPRRRHAPLRALRRATPAFQQRLCCARRTRRRPRISVARQQCSRRVTHSGPTTLRVWGHDSLQPPPTGPPHPHPPRHPPCRRLSCGRTAGYRFGRTRSTYATRATASK
jgi:hypothetical protein